MNTQSYVSWSYTGSDHTGFKLERSTPESGSWTTVFTCSNVVTTYYDDAAWWGDVLLYRVSAVNYWGTGPTSSIAPVFIVPPPADLWAWQHGTTTQSVVFWHFEGRHTMSLSRSSDGGSTWDWGIELPPMQTDSRSAYYYIDDTVSVGNTYTYRVQEIFSASIEPTSSLASVTILPETSSRTAFAVTADAGYQYNDIDDTPWGLHTASLHEANRVARATMSVNAWILAGDNYYNAENPGALDPNTYGGYEGQAGRMLGPSSSLWACVGNHDLSDIGASYFLNYFKPPAGYTGSARVYTQSLNTVDVFFLDTTSTSGIALSQSMPQLTWLSQSTEYSRNNPNIQWRIAVVHVPAICSSGSHAPNPHLAAIPWQEWGIDIMVSGHVHWVERIESSSVVFLNTSLMGSDKRSITTASLDTKWWYTGEGDADYVWALLEINSGSNHHVLSMSFYSGSTKVEDTGSTDIVNAMKAGYSTVLMKPWYAPPTASAIQSGEPTASVSWIFSGEFSQSLFRSVDSGSTWPVTYSIDPFVYSYEDTAVAVDTSYWYKVRHLLWPTEPYSNVAEVFISSSAPPVPPPEAPLFLMVSSGSAILDWSGSVQADYYNIYKAPSEGGPYTLIGTSPTTHSVDYNVTASNTYWYKVTAVNAGGESAESNEAELDLISCVGHDFAAYMREGYINHGDISTYRNNYGKFIPISTSLATQSISVWGRSKDFDVYLALVDQTGSVVVESDWNGWVPSGDVSFGNAAFNYVLKGGYTYNIELSSTDNAIGRYKLYISPGARLETSWSTSIEPTDCFYVSSSNYVVVGESGTKLVFWDTVNNTGSIIHYSQGINGACYSPTQDRVFAWVYKQGPSGVLTMSIDEYDNVGNYVTATEYPRYSGQSQVGVPDFSGYLSYDEFNDRILFARYNYSTVANIIIWDCATRSTVAALSSSALQGGYGFWMSCYSAINNSYYVAQTYNSSLLPGRGMVKVDGSTFTTSSTSVKARIVVSYISESNTMSIRLPGNPGKVALYDPVSDTIIHTQDDLPSSGLFEAAGVGDACTNVYVFGIDDQGGPNVPAVALLDRNTYLPMNYLALNSETISNDPFTPDGFYGYSLCFAPNVSRIYSAQQTYDGATEGRLYSIRLSRIRDTGWIAPYTASEVDTASCVWFSGSYKITSSVPGPTEWMGRAYPRYITSDGNTTVVSDNDYLLDGTFQHNRHNWFFSTDGQTRYNDYTESYTHTWPGRNAVVCNGKYYILSDGTTYQSPSGEAITASTMLVFDSTGSLSASIALTYGAMDWCSDGESVWVFEHDGTNAYVEQITGSNSTIENTYNLYVNGAFDPAVISDTASFENGIDYGYYYGKMLSFIDSNGSSWNIVNNVLDNTATESGSGDMLWSFQSGYSGYSGYRKSFVDDGTTGYGGWAGSICYCPLTDTVFIGAWGTSPDYPPLIIEVNPDMTDVYTYDLSWYTGSGFRGVDDIKWDARGHKLIAYNYWSDVPGWTLLIDPVAHTVVCELSPLEETSFDSIIGASAGASFGVNPSNGEYYFPQRFDGDISAYTGSVKVYMREPYAIPDPPAPPAAPYSLSASVVTTYVQLTWESGSDNQEYFVIDRSTDGINYTSSYATSSISQSYYDDYNVTASNWYWYQVAAVNANGTSSYSDTASLQYFPA